MFVRCNRSTSDPPRSTSPQHPIYHDSSDFSTDTEDKVVWIREHTIDACIQASIEADTRLRSRILPNSHLTNMSQSKKKTSNHPKIGDGSHISSYHLTNSIDENDSAHRSTEGVTNFGVLHASTHASPFVIVHHVCFLLCVS